VIEIDWTIEQPLITWVKALWATTVSSIAAISPEEELGLTFVRTVTIDGLVRKTLHQNGPVGLNGPWREQDWDPECIKDMLKALNSTSTTQSTRLTDWLMHLLAQMMHCMNRCIALLGNYDLSLCPKTCQLGDIITVLHGSSVPAVLRPQGDVYNLVGVCYVDGIMYGEAVDWEEDEADIFVLV